MLAEEAVVKKQAIYQGRGSSHDVDDLREPTKWTISDVKQFEVIVQKLEHQVSLCHDRVVAHVANVGDLESNLLKGRGFILLWVGMIG